MARRSHHSAESFEEWLGAFTTARHSRRRAFAEADNWAALHDAGFQILIDDERRRVAGNQRLDPDDQLPVPRWILEALVLRLLKPALPTLKTHTGVGRHARWRKRYQQDLIDWERFLQVWYRRIGDRDSAPVPPKMARSRRLAYHKQAQAKRSRFVVDVATAYPLQAGRDPLDLSVFEATAKVLDRTVYGGSAQAIRDSYDRVTRALSRGEAGRYYPSRWVRFAEHIRSAENELPR